MENTVLWPLYSHFPPEQIRCLVRSLHLPAYDTANSLCLGPGETTNLLKSKSPSTLCLHLPSWRQMEENNPANWPHFKLSATDPEDAQCCPRLQCSHRLTFLAVLDFFLAQFSSISFTLNVVQKYCLLFLWENRSHQNRILYTPTTKSDHLLRSLFLLSSCYKKQTVLSLCSWNPNPLCLAQGHCSSIVVSLLYHQFFLSLNNSVNTNEAIRSSIFRGKNSLTPYLSL